MRQEGLCKSLCSDYHTDLCNNVLKTSLPCSTFCTRLTSIIINHFTNISQIAEVFRAKNMVMPCQAYSHARFEPVTQPPLCMLQKHACLIFMLPPTPSPIALSVFLALPTCDFVLLEPHAYKPQVTHIHAQALPKIVGYASAAFNMEVWPPRRFLSGSEGPPSRAAAAGTAIASGTMTSEETKLAGFRADFELGLSQLEAVLAKSGGPFFLG